MATATRTKPAAETPGTEPPPSEPESPAEEKSATIGDVKQIVADAVDSLKGLFRPGAPVEEPAVEEPAKPSKRASYRDEEEAMNDLVSSKVAELLHKEKAAAENHPEPGSEKASPEPVPAAPTTRRVEKLFGWS